MKTMKRIVATLVAVLMIATTLLTVNVFADAVTFPDVAEDYGYRNAIYSLVQKGIINGIQQEDGTFIFKPDATITRAEFAKMITVALAGNVTLTEKTDKFPDVADSHWANTYIAYAVKAGIINGRDDGTFRPENPVTYGEAIKMLVCAKGYGSLYTQTAGQPWYFGYIKIANDINLTKSAQALGDAEAPRGMVAQLIYNMDYTKKIDITAPGDGPEIDLGEDDEFEEGSGAVVAVFENSLTGENYGLTKFQIMIDDTVYKLGDNLTLNDFYDYIGTVIEFEYSEDGSVPVIEKVTEYGRNESVTISAEDIESVENGVIEYYESESARKTTEAKLANDLYVIYNGQGVAKKDITDDFIEEYFNIECGEIRLENNDGSKDYEIAYVTSYDTYYVTGRTANKDLYTFNDSYSGKSVVLENNDDDYVVYKVTTAGGSKSASTVSGISSSKVVLSVAAPLGTKGVTEAIVSTATLKNAEVDEMSGYDEVIIDNKEYAVSQYYMDLIDTDESTYGFKVGDKATFYLDYAGRIVFMTKSESTDPYAYVLGFDEGTGLDSGKAINLFAVSGSSASEIPYPLKSTVKVNGFSEDAASVAKILRDNAEEINAKMPSKNIENGEYGQLIQYTTANVGGVTHISEIYTIDPDDLENGDIVPGLFKTTADGDKEAFSDGNKLTYNSTSKSFTVGGSNQFVINSSTVVILVPKDRSDASEFKKRTSSYFTNGNSYVVEPYDVTGNVAKVVLVYTTGSNAATVSSTTTPVFIQRVGGGENDKGEKVDKIYYYNAGDEVNEGTKPKEILTSERYIADGVIDSGDIVKLAIDDGEVTKIQKVFVDGVLYDYTDGSPFETFKATGNMIQHANGSDTDYYRVIMGTVDGVEGESLTVVPQIVSKNEDYNADNWEIFQVASNTRFYMFDSDDSSYSTEADIGSLNPATNNGKVDAVNASNVVVVVMGNTIKAIYILDAYN